MEEGVEQVLLAGCRPTVAFRVLASRLLMTGVGPQSAGDSSGDGTIAFSITSRSTGRRSHTSGAVNPPKDRATTEPSLRGIYDLRDGG